MNLSQVFNQKRKEGEMVLNEFSDSLTRQVGEGRLNKDLFQSSFQFIVIFIFFFLFRIGTSCL